MPIRLKPKVNESALIRTEIAQKSQEEHKAKTIKPLKTVKNRYSLKMGSERANLPSKTSETREKS
jgi:hypothetical protein